MNRGVITVIGPAIADIMVSPVSKSVFDKGTIPVDKIKMTFGGNALNEAVILGKLGSNVEIVSKLGADNIGKQILDYMKINHVNTSKVLVEERLDTGINIVMVDKEGERFFLTNPNGSLRRYCADDIKPLISSMGDIVCFSSLFVSKQLTMENMEDVFSLIKSRKNRTLIVDMTTPKNGEKVQNFKNVFKYIDYILPNEKEAKLLTGKSKIEDCAKEFIKMGVKCAIIKLASKGSYIKTQCEEYYIPAYETSNCIDTTGAGDSYVAGFIWGLRNGLNIRDCGYFASAVASCIVESIGANEGIESINEPKRRYEMLLNK